VKVLSGSPINVPNDVVGKVTHRYNAFSNKHDLIFVTTGRKYPKGFAAVITSNARECLSIGHDRRLSIVCNVEGIDELTDGDVVCVNPSGSITVLFSKEAVGNALLVTEKCNCACIMCPQPPTDNEIDKTTLNLKIVSLIDKKTPMLGLTGGEPTLLGDRFIEILHACKTNLPRTEISLLSNGVAFSNMDFAKKIRAIQHPSLTIDIPLYADTDVEHNKIVGANVFFKVVQGLYNLALLKQRIGIRIVILKLNSNRLRQLAEFIYRNFPFVIHIAFMQMETTGMAKDNIQKLWIDPHDYAQDLEDAVKYLSMRDMNVSVYNSQLCVLPKILWNFSRKSISSWKNIYLNECQDCVYMKDCGGFFNSSDELHSTYIKAVKKNTLRKITLDYLR